MKEIQNCCAYQFVCVCSAFSTFMQSDFCECNYLISVCMESRGKTCSHWSSWFLLNQHLLLNCMVSSIELYLFMSVFVTLAVFQFLPWQSWKSETRSVVFSD